MSVEVSAPMPGTISEVLASVGDEVKFDNEIIVLEAMKMNNPICAPTNGRTLILSGCGPCPRGGLQITELKIGGMS